MAYDESEMRTRQKRIVTPGEPQGVNPANIMHDLFMYFWLIPMEILEGRYVCTLRFPERYLKYPNIAFASPNISTLSRFCSVVSVLPDFSNLNIVLCNLSCKLNGLNPFYSSLV